MAQESRGSVDAHIAQSLDAGDEQARAYAEAERAALDAAPPADEQPTAHKLDAETEDQDLGGEVDELAG